MKIELKDLFSLKNKVIVITGAAGLLGKKHAEVIAAYGGSPVLLDISFDSVAKMSDRLNRKYGVESSGYSVDITNESEIEKNLKLVVKKYGKIDGLVNNAANNPKMEEKSEKNFSRLENFKLDIWDQDVQVGLTGAFLCVKHYGFQISKNPNGGVIINISSDLGLIAPDQRLYAIEGVDSTQQSVKPVSYSVVKSGLIGLTRYVATYWADKNVRCNAMCPGGVENNQPDDFIKKVSFRIPMGRLAQKDEYLSTLIWMLSESSSYLHGAIVPIDGGRTTW